MNAVLALLACAARRFRWSYHKISLFPDRRWQCNALLKHSMVSNKPPEHGTHFHEVLNKLGFTQTLLAFEGIMHMSSAHRGMTLKSLYYTLMTLHLKGASLEAAVQLILHLLNTLEFPVWVKLLPH